MQQTFTTRLNPGTSQLKVLGLIRDHQGVPPHFWCYLWPMYFPVIAILMHLYTVTAPPCFHCFWRSQPFPQEISWSQKKRIQALQFYCSLSFPVYWYLSISHSLCKSNISCCCFWLNCDCEICTKIPMLLHMYLNLKAKKDSPTLLGSSWQIPGYCEAATGNTMYSPVRLVALLTLKLVYKIWTISVISVSVRSSHCVKSFFFLILLSIGPQVSLN